MIDGFYSVKFQTPIAAGNGVLILDNGSIKGGDSSMIYRGSYKDDGDRFEAKLSTDTHPNLPSIPGVFGASRASLAISATIDRGSISGTATSPEAPGIEMKFIMTRLDP